MIRRAMVMAAAVALAGCSGSEPEPAENIDANVENVAVENVVEEIAPPLAIEVANVTEDATPPPPDPVQEPADIAADAAASGMTARLPAEGDSQPANASE